MLRLPRLAFLVVSERFGRAHLFRAGLTGRADGLPNLQPVADLLGVRAHCPQQVGGRASSMPNCSGPCWTWSTVTTIDFGLGLSEQEKHDLVEYLKSL
jgi:hypothetical protein